MKLKLAIALVLGLLFGGAAGCASNQRHEGASHPCTLCKCGVYTETAGGSCSGCGCPSTAHGYATGGGSGSGSGY